MEEGYEKGDSNNLPKINSFMVAKYLSEKNEYVSAEIRGKKLERSGRENYGDDAIGYVQLKRDGNLYTVKCRMTPEHRVREKPYHCTAVCNESDFEVLTITCEDCAASRGGCKHAVAFLMWLHRRTEEPSTTEVKCYWKKSTLSSVGTTLKCIKAKDFGSQQPQAHEYDSEVFFEKLLKKLRESDVKCQLTAYVNDVPEMQKLSMHYIICAFIKESTDLDTNAFFSFCKFYYTKERCEMVQNATLTQSDSELWYEMRYGRVTASKAHEAAHCRSEEGCLVESIFGAKILTETKAMKRGKILEGPVRDEVARLKNIKINQSGLFLCPDHPYFGATPDGLADDYVIEIKCPSKASAFTTYLREDGTIARKHYAQIQTQMHITKKGKGLFCIAHIDFETSKKVDIYEVLYDKVYCDDLFTKISKFWQDFIYTKLINVKK